MPNKDQQNNRQITFDILERHLLASNQEVFDMQYNKNSFNYHLLGARLMIAGMVTITILNHVETGSEMLTAILACIGLMISGTGLLLDIRHPKHLYMSRDKFFTLNAS